MPLASIQFDPQTMPLLSDLHILATVKIPDHDEVSLYVDLNGVKTGIQRTEYVNRFTETQQLLSDAVSVVTSWRYSGGPNVVILPEGQRLLLGDLPNGAIIDVAVWRTFDLTQIFTHRIFIVSNYSGVVVVQPELGMRSDSRWNR